MNEKNSETSDVKANENIPSALPDAEYARRDLDKAVPGEKPSAVPGEKPSMPLKQIRISPEEIQVLKKLILQVGQTERDLGFTTRMYEQQKRRLMSLLDVIQHDEEEVKKKLKQKYSILGDIAGFDEKRSVLMIA